MSYTSAVLADNPSVFYLLDETSGTTLVDASPNGRNGVYDSTLPSKGVSLVPGDAGQCNAYTGTGKTAHVSYGAWLLASALTLSFWYKTSYSPGAQSIILDRLQDNTSIINTYRVTLVSGGFLNFSWYDAGGSTRAVIGGSLVNDGTAHHLAITHDGTQTIKFYVDGVLDITRTQGTGLWQGTNGEGSLQLSDDQAHSLDSVAHWGTALSGAQIAAHYAATQPDPVKHPQSLLSRNGAVMQRATH